MAYTPTNWECGDVVTAEKLNKLEEAVEDLSIAIDGEGGGSEPLVINVVASDPATVANSATPTLRAGGGFWLDKTWSEIKEAFPNAYVHNSNASQAEFDSTIQSVFKSVFGSADGYSVVIFNAGSNAVDIYNASTADGYPKLEA